MGYCNRCFEHIGNDCILDSGICVFCYYKTKTWESNGKIISKKHAKQNWEKSFISWRNYYLSYYKNITKAIRNSPKGTFQTRKIKGHLYYYLVYREGEKVKFKYYGRQIPKDLQEKIELRKRLVKKLAKIRAMLYSLRITPRPTRKINSYSIFKRDKFTCQYCGRTPKDSVKLHVDHIVPLDKGGDNIETNLITSCHKCNLEKHDS